MAEVVVTEAKAVGEGEIVEMVELSHVEGVTSDSATKRKIFIVLREALRGCIVGFCSRNL